MEIEIAETPMKAITLAILCFSSLAPAFAQADVYFGPTSRWVISCKCPGTAGVSVEQTFQSLSSAKNGAVRDAAMRGIRCSTSEVSCGSYERCE